MDRQGDFGLERTFPLFLGILAEGVGDFPTGLEALDTVVYLDGVVGVICLGDCALP